MKDIADQSINESPNKPELMDDLNVFNNQVDDPQAIHLLKDIIHNDYKQLSSDELTEVISQNRTKIGTLLKKYVVQMQREEQRKKDQRMLAEQSLKKLSAK